MALFEQRRFRVRSGDCVSSSDLFLALKEEEVAEADIMRLRGCAVLFLRLCMLVMLPCTTDLTRNKSQ